MVAAQLVEWSLPTPEIRGSNPDISKIFIYQLYNGKDENKEKEAGNVPSFLKTKWTWVALKWIWDFGRQWLRVLRGIKRQNQFRRNVNGLHLFRGKFQKNPIFSKLTFASVSRPPAPPSQHHPFHGWSFAEIGCELHCCAIQIQCHRDILHIELPRHRLRLS